MKKNANILKRVEQYKYKRGISYATTDGKLYGAMRVCATLSFIYFMIFNGLYVLAQSMMIGLGQTKFADVRASFVPITVCTALIIAGYVLNCTRLRLWGCFLCIPTLTVNLIVFTRTLLNASSGDVVDISNYILGMPPLYYYRHLIPTVLLFIFFVAMLVIDIRARVKTNKLYIHITECLYEQYNSTDRTDLTDEEWEDFINNYSSSGYKNQFEQNTEDNE